MRDSVSIRTAVSHVDGCVVRPCSLSAARFFSLHGGFPFAGADCLLEVPHVLALLAASAAAAGGSSLLKELKELVASEPPVETPDARRVDVSRCSRDPPSKRRTSDSVAPVARRCARTCAQVAGGQCLAALARSRDAFWCRVAV